ncbi:MAG: hypothetical protein DMG08_04925 [Acidobacteria bacterium]|nr:MAG: hypothetical protein DMG08_04925 [Acidobacteriota bacterium]PYV06296.1 MAG: hypothetical protein DMG10_02215 [Acidobacteriota bacterium]PYV36440.1 MAG: hypothetical protein DMG09_17340 [Acidobacteriota bacterium]
MRDKAALLQKEMDADSSYRILSLAGSKRRSLHFGRVSTVDRGMSSAKGKAAEGQRGKGGNSLKIFENDK